MKLSISLLLTAGLLLADTVSYKYDDTGRLVSATYGNGAAVTYAYDKAGNLLSRSVTGGSAVGPQISAGGVVNAASFKAPLVRGELASLFGTNLAPAIASAQSLPLLPTLGGVQITVAGFPAAIYYVSPSQVNFQVPFEAPITGSVPVVLTQNGVPSAPQQVTMAEYSPGIFQYARTATVLDPIIVHSSDNTLVTPTSPAAAGEALVIYATGAGTFDNTPATGAGASGTQISTAKVTPTISVGSASAQVIFAGLTPGFTGLLQINMVVPAGLAAGSTQPLVVQFGSNAAPAVNLYVK